MDDVNLTYPVEVLYSQGINADDVCIRLSTAIRIACIDDSGNACGIEFADSELDPFHDTHNVHCYFRIEATGGVSRAIKAVSDAVRLSLGKGKLKPVALSTSFDDCVNLDDTWVLATEFEAWCAARRIELGELWGQYWEQEHEILYAGASESEIQRRQAESPNFQEELKKLVAEHDGAKGSALSTSEALSTIFAELAAYRSSTKRDRPEKLLHPTERKTLLSIIAVLCSEAKIPYNKPAKAAGLIQSTAAKMGVSIGETTIEGHLKKIPDALATRMK